MLAAVGNSAIEITRIQVGPIELGDLKVSVVSCSSSSSSFLFDSIFSLHE
jgi:16S rRNA U516 pseudouridylate synthase RsuA-like enzyme